MAVFVDTYQLATLSSSHVYLLASPGGVTLFFENTLFYFVNLGPFRKIAGEIRWFGFREGYLGPLKV